MSARMSVSFVQEESSPLLEGSQLLNRLWGDCSDCRLDYIDHLLHHRACHLLCKYCENLHETFPQYSYTKRKYSEDPEPFKAFMFKHVWDDRSQNSGDDYSGLFMSDNCASIFKRKADLRRHEISQHFEFKHSFFYETFISLLFLHTN